MIKLYRRLLMDNLAKYVFVKPKASLKKKIDLKYEQPIEEDLR